MGHSEMAQPIEPTPLIIPMKRTWVPKLNRWWQVWKRRAPVFAVAARLHHGAKLIRLSPGARVFVRDVPDGDTGEMCPMYLENVHRWRKLRVVLVPDIGDDLEKHLKGLPGI